MTDGRDQSSDDAGKRAAKPSSDTQTSGGAPNGESSRDGGPQDGGKKPKKGLLQRPLLLAGAGLVLLIIAVGGLLWWLHARKFEGTDDAFIDTHIIRLAPQVSGQVTRVLVDDNQLVQAGDTLLLVDSADAQTRVAQAQAQRAQAQSQVDAARDQIRVDEAALRQARADEAAAAAPAADAARNLARYRELQTLNRLAVAQQQLDQALYASAQADAQAQSAAHVVQQRAAQITAARTQVITGGDEVRAAEAQLREAGITLGYTRIVAPVDGYVTQRTVAAGNFVQPGTQVMAIVPLAMWVTANFKETQLARMRVGQKASIHVDACPGDDFQGHIDSFQHGSGQAFGILPPENATGNYVKVVQRVPVKILIDNRFANCPLGPGLSVEPSVRVR